MDGHELARRAEDVDANEVAKRIITDAKRERTKPRKKREIASAYVRIPNFEQLRHYGSKRESTPWIKLHSRWLDDYAFSRLSDPLKLQVILLWMFANRCGNLIPNDVDFLTWRLATDLPIQVADLVAAGFLEPVPKGEEAAVELVDKRPEKSVTASDDGRTAEMPTRRARAAPAAEPEADPDATLADARVTSDLLSRFRAQRDGAADDD